MNLKSPSFSEGGELPVKFTADGVNISPELKWDKVPAGTQSFALICEDHDAPGGLWTHWIIYNIPAFYHGLPEQVSPYRTGADGSRQVKNDFGRIGYGGPDPPPGPAHVYRFILFALNSLLPPEAGIAERSDFYEQIEGSVLERAELTARYRRKF